MTRTPHPLEKSERNVKKKSTLTIIPYAFNYFMQYAKNEENMRLELLRHVQGLHAPLNLRMERAIAAKVSSAISFNIDPANGSTD